MPEMMWRKSSRSHGGAQNCVEVGYSPEIVGVRDTKDRDGGTLLFGQQAWHGFLRTLKS